MRYVQETDKPSKIKKFFNYIQVQDNHIILPIQEEKIDIKKAEILANRTIKILNKNNTKKIVLSKTMKKQEKYINFLISKKIEIVDSKWLFEVVSYDVIEYILNKRKQKKELSEITVLINENTFMGIDIIKLFAKSFKRVNIVSKEIEKFKKLEEQLQEQGIIITVSNNKRTSLKKAEIILNIDFSKETINKYNIFENAVIINIQGNVKIDKKRFNGVVINDYDVLYQNSEIESGIKSNYLEKFDKKDIYEAQFYKTQNFDNVRKIIKKDNVFISKLIGNNGVIENF